MSAAFCIFLAKIEFCRIVYKMDTIKTGGVLGRFSLYKKKHVGKKFFLMSINDENCH